MSILVPPIGWSGSQLPWTPAEINPYAWYDAELSPKTFGTGTQVATWEDISGNARHINQSTSAARPTYSSGSKWVDFDGSNDYLAPSMAFLPSGNTPFTLFAVLRWDVTTADKYFFGQGVQSGNSGLAVGTKWNSAGMPAFGWVNSELAAGSFSTNTDYLMSYRYTSGARQFWQNGTSVASDGYSSSNIQATASAVGAYLGNSRYFDGKVRTVIVFRSALSTENRQKVEGYLAHRWGLTGSLPGNHPYKLTPPDRTPKDVGNAWTPADLTNLVVWYDPSDITTLWQNYTKATAVSAGGQSVGYIENKANAGTYDLWQSTSNARPVYRTSGGISYLDFMSSDFLVNDAVTNVPVGTAIIGCYFGSGSDANAGVLTNPTDQGAGVDFVFTRKELTAAWDTEQAAGGGLANSTHFWNNKVQSPAITFNAARVYSADGTSFPAARRFPNGIKIGWDRNNSSRYLVGRVYGVIITSDILSQADRELAIDWMAAQAGIEA